MVSLAAMESAVTSVGMGQIRLATRPAGLSAVLGSCVGVAIFHPRLSLGLLAHVVLPDSFGRSGNPGKFADTAIPEMLAQLEKHGGKAGGSIAKIAGGACMFSGSGPLQIGLANIDAVTKALERAGLRIAGKDVGGTNGRRVTLDCGTGVLLVESVGQQPKSL